MSRERGLIKTGFGHSWTQEIGRSEPLAGGGRYVSRIHRSPKYITFFIKLSAIWLLYFRMKNI